MGVNNRRRTKGAITASRMGSVAIILALVGCAGHGRYTSQHLSAAEEKLSMIKSGTEWQMAHQQFMAGELDKSLKSINHSLALNDKVAKSHVLKGRILMERGELEQARASFVAAEVLDPAFADAQYYLGILHERYQQQEEALARYMKAYELDRTNAQYLIAAAEMQMDLGRLDEAEALLVAAGDSFRYSAAVHQTLGHIALMRSDTDRAVLSFSEANTLLPDDPMIIEDLARAQIDAGRFADAEYNLRRLIDLQPQEKHRELKRLRARCLAEVDRPVDARAILLELTADSEGSRDVESWIELGKVAVSLKDEARLRLASSRVLAIAPDRYEGHLLRALQRRSEGDIRSALASAQTAATLSQSDATPHILAGLLSRSLHDDAAAMQHLQAALEMNPDDENVRRLLGSLGTVAGHPEAE